jgi:hypothetical protein
VTATANAATSIFLQGNNAAVRYTDIATAADRKERRKEVGRQEPTNRRTSK